MLCPLLASSWGEPSSSTHHLPNKSADSSPTASTVRRHLTKEERTNPHAHQEARGFYFTWLLFDTPLTSHPYDFILGLDKTDLSLLASMQGFKYDNDESDKELSREDWLLYVLSAQNQQLKKAATLGTPASDPDSKCPVSGGYLPRTLLVLTMSLQPSLTHHQVHCLMMIVAPYC
jgi:hypothetical protein